MPHYEEIPLGSPRDRLQSEIDEVVVIMKDNATRVMERGASIATMDERASQLIEGSRAFERTSRRTKRQMMWENMKQNFASSAPLSNVHSIAPFVFHSFLALVSSVIISMTYVNSKILLKIFIG